MIAVVLSMGLLGFLFKKLDGMLYSESPLLVRALGVSWLACYGSFGAAMIIGDYRS